MVLDEPRFTAQLLQPHFQHNHFTSFTRALNAYQFSRKAIRWFPTGSGAQTLSSSSVQQQQQQHQHEQQQQQQPLQQHQEQQPARAETDARTRPQPGPRPGPGGQRAILLYHRNFRTGHVQLLHTIRRSHQQQTLDEYHRPNGGHDERHGEEAAFHDPRTHQPSQGPFPVASLDAAAMPTTTTHDLLASFHHHDDHDGAVPSSTTTPLLVDSPLDIMTNGLGVRRRSPRQQQQLSRSHLTNDDQPTSVPATSVPTTARIQAPRIQAPRIQSPGTQNYATQIRPTGTPRERLRQAHRDLRSSVSTLHDTVTEQMPQLVAMFQHARNTMEQRQKVLEFINVVIQTGGGGGGVDVRGDVRGECVQGEGAGDGAGDVAGEGDTIDLQEIQECDKVAREENDKDEDIVSDEQ